MRCSWTCESPVFLPTWFSGGFLAPPATVGQVAGTPVRDLRPSPSPRDILFGQCPVVEVGVNDQKIQCLVDTGSQVTLFTESLCKELFNEQQLQETETPWLTLRGANGLDIPYVGYMVADFQVRDIKVSGKGVVIVKDHCLGAHRALLGMNVLAAYWEGLFEKQQAATFSSTSEHPEWDHIITDCLSAAMAQQHHEDTARVACRYAIAIPALSEALVWARLPVRTYGSESWVMVEPHNRCSEIEVAHTLATVHHVRVPVRVRNLQPYPVHLYRHQGLARVTAVGPQQVRKDQDISLTRVSPGVIEVGIVQASQGVGVSAGGMPQHMSCESLQGGGLNPDQQRQLQLLLVKWQHVFSTHDEDYGCTGGVLSGRAAAPGLLPLFWCRRRLGHGDSV